MNCGISHKRKQSSSPERPDNNRRSSPIRPPDLKPPDLKPPDLGPPVLRLPDLSPPNLRPPDLKSNNYLENSATEFTNISYEKPSLNTSPTESSCKISSTKFTQSVTLLEFVQSIDKDILQFLKGHTLNVMRRPFMSPSGMSPLQFSIEHKDLYDRAMTRTNIPESERDSLVEYLCQKYTGYLCSQPGQVYGRLQRLEDVMDFVLQMYNNRY